MVQFGKGEGFFPKAFVSSLIGQQPFRQDAQRHLTFESLISGEIDNTHSTLAEFPKNAIVAERLPDHCGGTPPRGAILGWAGCQVNAPRNVCC